MIFGSVSDLPVFISGLPRFNKVKSLNVRLRILSVHETEYAESPEDFVHKLKIALKECHESEYWLMVLGRCVPELADEVERLRKDAGAIRYMLIASIRTRLRNLRA